MVLEARTRVGGRVFTLLDEPGYPEMGFNSMGSGYGRAIDAAHRANVQLVDLSPRQALAAKTALVLGGRVVPDAAWPQHPRNSFPEPYRKTMPWALVSRMVSQNNPLKDWADWTKPQSAPLDVSLYDFLRAHGLDDAAIALANDTAPLHGDSARSVSALMYEFSDGWTKSQIAAGGASYGVVGGNSHLPAGMAKLLKGELLLGRAVTGIAATSSGVTVTCRDGRRYHARRVVLAIPFSVLRTMRLDPALPARQAAAVKSLGYEAISLAFLRVKTPFWAEDGVPASMWTDGPAGVVAAQHFGSTPEEVTGLIVAARGRLSRKWDAMGAQAAKQMIVAEIEAIRPAAKGKLTAAHMQSWTLEPFNRGDWSVWGPGQISAYVNVMSLPAGRVHFAGEHTGVGNRGLESAMESSERAAMEVLAAV
jgi:monoamine oxidase